MGKACCGFQAEAPGLKDVKESPIVCRQLV